MLRISLLLLGLAAIQNVNVSLAQEHYYCRTTEMPVSWKTDSEPVKIVHSSAVFSELGATAPAFDVRNTQAAAITNLDIVIEYLDEKGLVVDTATTGGAAAGFENAMPAPFPLESTETWKVPLDPGAVARVQGLSEGTRTVACPVKGQITFVMARFQNGAAEQYGSAGWQVPPLPRIVPQLDSACPVVPNGFLEVPAKVKISNAGEVLGISPSSAGDPRALAWASAQVKRWKFHPALVDGQPTASELSVDFVFHNSPDPNLAAVSPLAPSFLIQFFPGRFVPSSSDSQPNCIESFAQLRDGATIP